MQNRSRSVWTILILVLLTGSVWGLAACGKSPKPEPTPWPTRPRPAATMTPTRGIRVGQRAPDFSLPTTRGTTVSLKQYRGQPVLVTFFATWCTPCREDLPGVQKVYKQYREKGLAIIAVDQKESSDEVVKFASIWKLTFPLALDQDGRVSDTYQARSIPRSFFIDPNGVIRKVGIGYMGQDDVARAVDSLFQYAVADESPDEVQPATAPLPPPTEPPAPKPVKRSRSTGPAVEGCVNVGSALVRGGPGKNYPAAYTLEMGKCTSFDAQSTDGAWLRLVEGAPQGGALWMTAEYITLKGEIGLLPVAE